MNNNFLTKQGKEHCTGVNYEDLDQFFKDRDNYDLQQIQDMQSLKNIENIGDNLLFLTWTDVSDTMEQLLNDKIVSEQSTPIFNSIMDEIKNKNSQFLRKGKTIEVPLVK